MKWLISIFCLCLYIASPTISGAENNIAEETYARLDKVRQQKKIQILQLFGHVQEKAESMKHDKFMIDFFFFLNELNAQNIVEKQQSMSQELKQVVNKYILAIDQYYLQNYLEFYDILFIEKNGDIFHTIRKEEDFRKNIFTSNLSNTRLAKQLKENPDSFFVDYQYYFPADEPAAFFIVPMVRNGVHEGWILMQYAINKLNMLMVDYQELGETGEIYLVNQDHLILTNSRFKAGEVSLSLRVETEAVDSAFLSGEGHKLISGYRGVKVFTSFEKFTLWGTQWALVASIEEDEIITDYFLQNKESLVEPMFKRLVSNAKQKHSGPLPDGQLSKVDIDEIRKVRNGSFLQTRGVSTCTAITVLYPDHFAYLAHISPFDKIYGHVNLTNQLKDLISRIKYHDIYLRDLSKLKFIVIANHLNSFDIAIDKLIRHGIRLSQITFAYNQDSQYSNVTSTGDGKETFIEWVMHDGPSKSFIEKADTIETLSDVVMQVSGYTE